MPGIGNKRAGVVDLAAKQRALTAIKLRAQHLTWREVAERAGYANASAAHNAVKRELDRDVHESVEEMRRAIGASYDETLAWLHPQIFSAGASKEDKEHALWCLDRYTRVLAQKSQLFGALMSSDEKLQALPYRKAIVLEEPDAPLQLPEPSVDGDVVER